MTRKRILITGAAGFVGLHLARRLMSETDIDLTLVDDLSRGEMDDDLTTFVKSYPHVRFRQINLRLPFALLEIPTPFNEIYHLAAVNGTKRFYDMPADVLRTNLTTIMRVLELARRTVPHPRVMFTSSNEAYAGALEAFGALPIPTPEGVPLVVSDPYNPRWSYAASKLAGEALMIGYGQQYGVPGVIVRPHNFYGPRAGMEHVIPGMLSRIWAGENPLEVPGADETRSFCYITDAVDALVRLMPVASEAVPTFHIGSTEEIRIGELTTRLCHVAGATPSVVEVPGLPGSVKRRCPDVSKIATEIGWEATTSLEQGLRQTAAWYWNRRNHPSPAG